MKWLVLVSLIAVTSFAGGCSTTRPTSVARLSEKSDDPIRQPQGQKITGYTMASGAHHAFDGWARIEGPDSIQVSGFRYEVEGKGGEIPAKDQVRLTLPTADVAQLSESSRV